MLTYVKLFIGDDDSFYKRIKGSVGAIDQILIRFTTITFISTILNIIKEDFKLENLKVGPVSIIPLYLSAQNLEIEVISLLIS